MADHAMTSEQIEAAIDKFHQAHPAHAAASVAPAAALPQFCPFYKSVLRPIMELVVSFPLIPQKIRDAVKLGISLLDKLCP